MSYTEYNAKLRNGFTRSGFLMSNLRFSGIVRIAEKAERKKLGRNGEDDITYYTIKDEFGASFSCFDKGLFDAAVPGESMLVEGKVKISKGSTYLNLQKIDPVKGSTYQTQWDNPDYLQSVRKRMIDIDLDQSLTDKWENAVDTKQYGTLAEVERILEQVEQTGDGSLY